MMTDFVICVECGQQNDAVAQTCSECGAWLPDAQNQTLLSTMGVQLRTELQEALDQESALPALGPNEIALQVIDFGDTMELTITKPIVLGRGDKARLSSTQFVDLSNYNAYGLGLSRDHAEIHYEDGIYYIIDLGSSNGTSVNGGKIPANESYQLENGDKIFLGRLGLIFYCG